MTRSTTTSLSELTAHLASTDAKIYPDHANSIMLMAKDVIEDITKDWDTDKEDEWSFRIAEAHPTDTGDYKTYTIAQGMVGNRRSKYDLVDLVNWLLKGQP